MSEADADFSPGSHVPALDGLRGLAILWVVPHNAGNFPAHSHGLTWVIALFANAGWIGVQLFFVLSGFLITGNLLDSRKASNYYRVFFARRALRILPLYYTVLLAAFVVAPLFGWVGIDESERRSHIWLWIFLSNWAFPLGVTSYWFWHFWSLAVEEQFYLVWPWALRLAGTPRLLRICALLAVLALVIRTVMHALGASTLMVYEFTVTRMDALALGAAAAILVRQSNFSARRDRYGPVTLPIAAALVCIGALFTRGYNADFFSTQTFGYSILALASALAIIAVAFGRSPWDRFIAAALSLPFMRALGKYSYAMYVFHVPIKLCMTRLLPQYIQAFGNYYALAWNTAVITLSFMAAWLSYHLLEKHFLKMKPRLNFASPLPLDQT
jgi:peptidoglycan/LPS O-acetylase OafA/YrhL